MPHALPRQAAPQRAPAAPPRPSAHGSAPWPLCRGRAAARRQPLATAGRDQTPAGPAAAPAPAVALRARARPLASFLNTCIGRPHSSPSTPQASRPMQPHLLPLLAGPRRPQRISSCTPHAPCARTPGVRRAHRLRPPRGRGPGDAPPSAYTVTFLHGGPDPSTPRDCGRGYRCVRGGGRARVGRKEGRRPGDKNTFGPRLDAGGWEGGAGSGEALCVRRGYKVQSMSVRPASPWAHAESSAGLQAQAHSRAGVKWGDGGGSRASSGAAPPFMGAPWPQKGRGARGPRAAGPPQQKAIQRQPGAVR
jgi:hypothetical protein